MSITQKNTKSVAKRLPDEIVDDESSGEEVEQLVGGFIRRQIDPLVAHRRMVEQAERDGDPRFGYALSVETLKQFPDRDFQWVAEADVRLESGKSRGYAQVYGKDGVTLASGIAFDSEEAIEWEGMKLMWGDKSRKLAREDRERRTNRETRAKMLKKNLSNRIVFVGNHGDMS